MGFPACLSCTVHAEAIARTAVDYALKIPHASRSPCSLKAIGRTIPLPFAPTVIAGTLYARCTTEFRTTPTGRRARVHRVHRHQHPRCRPPPPRPPRARRPRRPLASGNNSPSSAASSSPAYRRALRSGRVQGAPIARSSRGKPNCSAAAGRRARRLVAAPGRRCGRLGGRRRGGLARHLGRARSRQDGRPGQQGNARRGRAAGHGPGRAARRRAPAGR